MTTIIDIFFPPHCYACQRPVHGPGSRALCSGCLDRLQSIRIKKPVCRICGHPFAAGTAPRHATCLNCRIKAPLFDRARALFPYRGPAGAVVLSFKYDGQYHLGASLLRTAIESGWFPDEIAACSAVTAVPLHRRQRHRRGYNQAELLASSVAKHVSRPFVPGLIKRIRPTESQTKLAAGKRMENVQGAFTVRASEPPESILLVDDVLTTGATANECAREMKRAGCREVFVFTLLRGC